MKTLVMYEETGNIVTVSPDVNPDEPQPAVKGFKTLVWEGEVHPNRHYVENGKVYPLKAWDLRTGVTDKGDYYTVVLEILPKGTRVTWPDEVSEIVNDGRVILDVNLPGEYVFQLQHVQYPLRTEVIHVP